MQIISALGDKKMLKFGSEKYRIIIIYTFDAT